MITVESISRIIRLSGEEVIQRSLLSFIGIEIRLAERKRILQISGRDIMLYQKRGSVRQ